jgi:uncharacterized protein YheU (UPF0270 family)
MCLSNLSTLVVREGEREGDRDREVEERVSLTTHQRWKRERGGGREERLCDCLL